MHYLAIISSFLVLQLFILYLLVKEEYEFKFMISLIAAVLIALPIFLRDMGLRFLATFLLGIILFSVGILIRKKSYMYLGSICSLLIVISTSYWMYLLPS